jgi:hypothetical protein
MDLVLDAGSEGNVPTAIVGSDACLPAIGTLIYGINSTQPATDAENIFDSMKVVYRHACSAWLGLLARILPSLLNAVFSSPLEGIVVRCLVTPDLPGITRAFAAILCLTRVALGVEGQSYGNAFEKMPYSAWIERFSLKAMGSHFDEKVEQPWLAMCSVDDDITEAKDERSELLWRPSAVGLEVSRDGRGWHFHHHGFGSSGGGYSQLDPVQLKRHGAAGRRITE